MRCIHSPETWKTPSEHLSQLINHEWYKIQGILQSKYSLFTHQFFTQNKIEAALPPLTTNSVSSPMGWGSDSCPLDILINGKKTYLSDSAQFLLEASLRLHEKGVYYILPSFRGEKLDQRHLNQFYHAEAEIYGNLDDIIGLVGRYVHFITENIYNVCAEYINKIVNDTSHIQKLLSLEGNFPKIRYEEALNLLKYDNKAFEKIQNKYTAINSYGEKLLIEEFGGVVWLTHMPWIVVPFYQKKETGSEYSMTADLLMGIGETVGCGERTKTFKELQESIKYHNVDESPYNWYLELKQKSPQQTAGFGMGMERYLLWLTNTDDIRNCPLFLRDLEMEIYP